MNGQMNTRRNFLLMAGASLAVAGCGDIVGPGKALQLYVLAPTLPAAPAGGSGAPVTWQLAVALPQAPASLDTVRVALNPTPLTMDYFANASWPDRLPLMLQGLLLEGFEKDGRAPGAARDLAALHADYVLQTDIREFQAHYATPPEANDKSSDKASTPPPEIYLRIGTSLMAMPETNIVARKEWIASATANSNALPDIIAAFNTATAKLLADIINWTITAAPSVAPKAAEKLAVAPGDGVEKQRRPGRRARP